MPLLFSSSVFNFFYPPKEDYCFMLYEKALADVGRLYFAIESQIDKTYLFLKISECFLVYSNIYCYICSEI
jgi:hypothetical protein